MKKGGVILQPKEFIKESNEEVIMPLEEIKANLPGTTVKVPKLYINKENTLVIDTNENIRLECIYDKNAFDEEVVREEMTKAFMRVLERSR